jgi:peptidyl-prolyl cis-trans isomerase C
MNRTLTSGLNLAAALLLVTVSAQAAPVATVNDTAIDSKDILSDYEVLNELQKERLNKDPGSRREIVEGAVNAELLLQAAKKAGVEQDEEYKRALERFKKQFLATRYLQKSIDSKLGKSAVKEFFEKNKGSYDSTQVRAMHILVTDLDQANKIAEEAKKTKNDKEFTELAKKNSVDPTVQDNGGDLGFFTRDRMVPEFASAAFNMRKGEIKGPVKSVYGYHVIRLLEIKHGRVPNFEEVEARVKEDLRSSLAQETITKLRSTAKIKINDDSVRGLKF